MRKTLTGVIWYAEEGYSYSIPVLTLVKVILFLRLSKNDYINYFGFRGVYFLMKNGRNNVEQ